ncbi:MAG: hypothetical protein OQK72_09640 [Gammaproteobacteria bacterium]|nr:hypothetical protein [Gammaproteobacteria bacterium]
MTKKISTYCLCIFLALSDLSYAGFDQQDHIQSLDEQAIYEQYPSAKVLRVSAEQYPQLAKQLRSQGYSQSTLQLASNNALPDNVHSNQTQRQKLDDCNNISNSTGEESIDVMLDVSHDLLNNSSGGNGDGAAIVFVIVGTVLIIAWTLYVFKYFYDVATGFRPCGYWSQFTLTSSHISSNADESADFKGINYMTGFRDGATDAGISIELGHADVFLPQLINQRLRGHYWFIGPVLRWRFSNNKNPHYFNMNFLAGTTEHDEMGRIAKATLGLQFALGESAHLGFSWGAMNIDLKESQGLIHERNEYYYLYGINLGFGF